MTTLDPTKTVIDRSNATVITEVPSVRGFDIYNVEYHFDSEEFVCACPAYRYSRDKHCKHIARVGADLSAEADAEFSARRNVSPRIEDIHAIATRGVAEYNVIVNDGAENALDHNTVNWLIGALKSDDKVIIQRR